MELPSINNSPLEKTQLDSLPLQKHDRSSFSLMAVEYFDTLATIRRFDKRYNTFFGSHLSEFMSAVIPQGKKILMVGCHNFELLETLKPSLAVGIDCSRKIVELAREKNTNPQITFNCSLPEDFKTDEVFDYVILANVIDHCQDVLTLLGALRRFTHGESRIIANMLNPAWNGLIRVASAIGIRFPDYERNLVASRILMDSLKIKGFQITDACRRILLPRHVPFLSKFLNQFLCRLPFIERLCFVQYVAAKPRQSATAKPLTCSVLIPCYNEEGNIAECVRRTPQMGPDTEIVIINDGSKDRTLPIAHHLAKEYPNVRVIDQPKNGGKGKAVLAGMQAAKGDILIILDADMTVPPEELTEFYEVINSGEAEFASGTRFVYQMENGAMRSANYFGNRLFSFLIEVICGNPCSDTLCGTKAMRRTDFLDFKLQDNSWGDFDLIFHAAKKRLKSIQIPVHYKERVAGESKMRALRAGIRFLQLCLNNWKLIP